MAHLNDWMNAHGANILCFQACGSVIKDAKTGFGDHGV
jgi:hypothetical protein